MLEDYYIKQFAKARTTLVMEKIRESEKGYGKYVIPLYSYEGEKLSHVASSILLEYRHNHILVTNAHVADHCKKFGIDFPFFSQKEQLTFFSTPTPKSGNRDDDKIDYAYALLDRETVQAIKDKSAYSFLPETLIETNYAPQLSPLYTFMGYPGSKNKTHFNREKVVPKQYLLLDSHLKDEKLLKEYMFNRDRDIIIPFEKSKIMATDGNPVGFPKPIGMSGGAIWGWYTQDQGEIGNVSVSAKLIGLIREMPKDKKALIGTKISYLLRGIDRSIFIGRFV